MLISMIQTYYKWSENLVSIILRTDVAEYCQIGFHVCMRKKIAMWQLGLSASREQNYESKEMTDL